jgi:hypothetical protein
MSAVGGNYISDGAIMAWLAEQQDRIYGDLKSSMDLAERRADFQSALTNVKSHLAEANNTKDFSTVDAELQDLIDTYGSNPEFAEACAALKPMADRIHADHVYKTEVYPEAKANYDAAVADAVNATEGGTITGRGGASPSNLRNSSVESQKPADPISSYSEEDLDNWTNIVGGQVDNAGRNDQLTMIHIQELKATLDQGSQLASTFISSSDKTTSSILNNFV